MKKNNKKIYKELKKMSKKAYDGSCKMKSKNNPYRARDYSVSNIDIFSSLPSPPEPQSQEISGIPEEICLPPLSGSGFVFGMSLDLSSDQFIGMPQGNEGNIAVIGGNGSGKSASIARPTILNWKGAMVATDIKGELWRSYKKKYRPSRDRPYLIFNPEYLDGPSYDPLALLEQDNEENLFSNVEQIAMALIPDSLDAKEKYWIQSERAVFEAALFYYFKIGLSFSEIVCKILNATLSVLCDELLKTKNAVIKMLLGEISEMKPEVLADIDRGLRNKLMLFATDQYISHAFRGRREGAKCFSWQDLDRYNIFLSIPENRIEQWSRAFNLMYTQLIQYSLLRPDKNSEDGKTNIQTLLLMDEFPRFGKLDMIIPAVTTLRSKNVNICMMVQSIAQLDMIYGEHERRVILDNCQYQVILRSNDAETQQRLCNLIGTHPTWQKSFSCHFTEDRICTGYNFQMSENRETQVFPHELATLEDVLLLSPYGFFRLAKIPPDYVMVDQSNPSEVQVSTTHTARKRRFFIGYPLDQFIEAKKMGITLPGYRWEDVDEITTPASIPAAKTNTTEEQENEMRNVGAKMLTIEERTANAEQRCSNYLRQERDTARKERMKMDKNDKHRNYILGALVSKHFPAVRNLEPGTKAENDERFKSFESILIVLADDPELMENLKERAHRVELE